MHVFKTIFSKQLFTGVSNYNFLENHFLANIYGKTGSGITFNVYNTGKKTN